MIKQLTILFGFAALVLCNTAHAQVFETAEPASWRIDELMGDTYPVLTMPAVDNEALIAEDEAQPPGKNLPTRFAIRHTVDVNLESDGRWTTLKNGDRIWQIGIESGGALAMNLTFDEFFLANGCHLFIFNQDRSEVLGAITSQNNKGTGILGTTHLSGEMLIVELYEPFRVRGQSDLHIRSVTHAYKFIDAEVRSFGNSGECNINVDCFSDPATKEQSSSTVLMTVDEGTRWCTGSMVNNTAQNGKPYLLSTYESLVGDPASWVFYFNYENTDCEDGYKVSPLGRSISGAMLRASSPSRKFALYELSRIPPYEWKIYYAGWDRSATHPLEVRSIHHPSGDVKKISESGMSPIAYEDDWIVQEWDLGTTEPGSAGGSLLNEEGNLIGWLIDGTAACGHPGVDVFRRLNTSWEGPNAQSRLKDWLDPRQSGITQLSRIFPEIAYIDQAGFEEDLAVYPIPADDRLQFLYKGESELRSDAMLMDLSGRIVRTVNASVREIYVGDLPAGLYVFLYQSPSGQISRKVVIQ